ncbi:MAG: hypothetical protein E7029_02680 [Planctomycetaceae bacterium]|nr:hypothetical protein [Planctomycetaceae bacterium]MBP3694382.1 hypothetical protein [Thermoguttaceae bacterium]
MKTLLITIAIAVGMFLFFFFSIGFSHLIGRRKMMCSCGRARAMEKEREAIIKKIKNIEEVADKTQFRVDH